MPINFTRWLDMVGDQISKMREKESGVIELTFFTDKDEDELLDLYVLGLKPRAAALRFLSRSQPALSGSVRFKVGKYGGDDSYSFAVFDRNKPVVTGCTQAEARFHQRRLREHNNQS